jgi:hypothetical protein
VPEIDFFGATQGGFKVKRASPSGNPGAKRRANDKFEVVSGVSTVNLIHDTPLKSFGVLPPFEAGAFVVFPAY